MLSNFVMFCSGAKGRISSLTAWIQILNWPLIINREAVGDLVDFSESQFLHQPKLG